MRTLVPKFQNSGKVNPNWDKDSYKESGPFGMFSEVDGDKAFNKAYNFVSAYMNSPGFKRRFKEHVNHPELFTYNGNVFPDLYQYMAVSSHKKPRLEQYNEDNAAYDLSNNTVYYDPDYNGADHGAVNMESVMAHELGHWLDDGINYGERMRKYRVVTNPDGTSEYRQVGLGKLYSYGKKWSESYPIFRRNKAYQRARSAMSPETQESFDKHPMLYYKLYHDEQPGESYADLIELRSQLYRSGIYNSLKDQKFEQKHLDRFKKINPNSRLLQYFNDDDIIEMMNTVADNGSQKQENTYYA